MYLKLTAEKSQINKIYLFHFYERVFFTFEGFLFLNTIGIFFTISKVISGLNLKEISSYQVFIGVFFLFLRVSD